MWLEPPTACMQIMYDHHQIIEDIPNICSFLSLHTSIILYYHSCLLYIAKIQRYAVSFHNCCGQIIVFYNPSVRIQLQVWIAELGNQGQ